MVERAETNRNHPLYLRNQSKPAIKFNKNIPQPNLAQFGPKKLNVIQI